MTPSSSSSVARPTGGLAAIPPNAASTHSENPHEFDGIEQVNPEDFEDSDVDDPLRDKRSGRRKIRIEFIEDRSRRHITFSKRKAGIMKKAYELRTLTGTQVLLLVASETGHVYTFATPKLQPLITKPEGKNLIQACLNAPDHMSDLITPMNDSPRPFPEAASPSEPLQGNPEFTEEHVKNLVGGVGSAAGALAASSAFPNGIPSYANPFLTNPSLSFMNALPYGQYPPAMQAGPSGSPPQYMPPHFWNNPAMAAVMAASQGQPAHPLHAVPGSVSSSPSGLSPQRGTTSTAGLPHGPTASSTGSSLTALGNVVHSSTSSHNPPNTSSPTHSLPTFGSHTTTGGQEGH